MQSVGLSLICPWWIRLWGMFVIFSGCSSPASISPRNQSLAEIYAISDQQLSCEQAQELSYRTVERMGYTVTSVTQATQGGEGVVKAERRNRDRIEPVQVTIRCQPTGVKVDAASFSTLDVASDNPHPLTTVFSASSAPTSPENRPPPTTYFRRAFYSLFNGLATHAKQYGPEGEVQVRVRPFQSMEAELAFGAQASEVFVVSVEVSNLTPQTYVLDTQQVVLLTADGGRVNALTAKESSLPTQPLPSQTLASRVTTKGYLYYPAGEYVGAQGYLTAVGSQEREGFHIEF